MEKASRGVGNWDEALRRCNEAVEIYRRLGDNEMVASGIYETIDALLLMGQYLTAAETAERALAELKDDSGDSRADILAALGLIYTVFGDYARAKDVLSEAMSLGTRSSNPRLVASIHTNWSVFNGVFLELADDLSNSRKALEWSECSNHPWMRAIALNEQMMASHRVGRLEHAIRVSKELEPLARKIGHGVFLVTSIWTKAWAEFAKTPDLARLEQQLTESVELCRARVPMLAAQSLAQLSLAKFFGGQSSALDYAIDAGRVEVPGYLGGFVAGAIFRERAYAGDRAGALEFLKDASTRFIPPRENQPSTFGSWAFLVSAVEGLAILGERERAAEFYPLTLRLLDTGMITFSWVARFPQTIAGIAAAAGRQWERAGEHFRIALKQAEEMPDQLERADCRRFYGSMLLDRNAAGDADQARRLLTQALGDYSRIRMPLHIELTKALLAKL